MVDPKLLPWGSRRRWHPSAGRALRSAVGTAAGQAAGGAGSPRCRLPWCESAAGSSDPPPGRTRRDPGGRRAGSRGPGRSHFGRRKYVLTSPEEDSPLSETARAASAVVRILKSFGLVVCSMEGGCLYPSVLSAEMLLFQSEMFWRGFDGRETCLERGGVGSGCVCWLRVGSGRRRRRGEVDGRLLPATLRSVLSSTSLEEEDWETRRSRRMNGTGFGYFRRDEPCGMLDRGMERYGRLPGPLAYGEWGPRAPKRRRPTTRVGVGWIGEWKMDWTDLVRRVQVVVRWRNGDEVHLGGWVRFA